VPVADLANRHARQQKALARRTSETVRQLWRRIDRAGIAASWRLLIPQAVATLAVAQATAAGAAGGYTDDLLGEYGLPAGAVADVQPGAFAGTASDGRDLIGLLYQPAITALEQIGAGSTPARGLLSGQAVLDMIVRTQVADAGRVADGVALVARPGLTGYVRVLSAPSCSRCVILAGRRYTWSAGFSRHPRCDCRHVPVAGFVPDDVRVRPRAYFDSLDPAEQDRIFTKAGAEAIRDGADMARVVNARRGMQEADGRLFTTEAAGRRPRLMPEQIYRDARDRDDAIRLLRLHGYLR
jgi:hypothetical protein